METGNKNNKLKFKLLRNKYFIASVLFLAWVVFFDENSVVSHLENKRRLNELVHQKEYYKERIKEDQQKLEDLNAGESELEKFAREQYYMSKPDEDLFIVVEEN
ncbi:MAG: septum formation initiator family protein [Mariniphaga sp.]|nr:septum formation initiator family protein [Mariniphaga sp.]